MKEANLWLIEVWVVWTLPDERLLYAAKTDSEDMLSEVLALPETEFDVNHQDGLGNTGKLLVRVE